MSVVRHLVRRHVNGPRNGLLHINIVYIIKNIFTYVQQLYIYF